jgi:phage tail-like protein
MKSTISILGWGLVGLVALGGWLEPQQSAAAAARNYTVGHFVLELDGTELGLVSSVSGGGAVAEVVRESAAGGFAKKHLGSASYEDVELELGLSLASPIYDWVASSFQNGSQRRAVSIVSLDQNYNAVSQRAVQNALIAEITIPPCDATSKAPALLGLRLSSDRVSVGKASGKSTPSAAGKQKQWLSSNFRLELDAVDTSRVSQIDAFTIKRAGAQKASSRGASKEAGGVEFPNLAVTLAEAGSESWQKWHEDFVINGKATDQQEKSGRLVFLGPNLKDELLEIKLHNVGIFALRPSKRQAGTEGSARLDAELYVERMEFVPKGPK